MKALVIIGPGVATVENVEAPVAAPGEVVVAVQRTGICGTDLELFSGHMQYLHDGRSTYPLRIGHEWMGTVAAVGPDVDRAWVGRRVTGDTMIGCGSCERCRSGRHHVCAFRHELGVTSGRPGALAEQVAVPVSSLYQLPDTVTDTAGALVEPGGNAWRAVDGAGLVAAERLLVVGSGTIGQLCAMFAHAAGVEVHILGNDTGSLAFAGSFGWDGTWTEDDLPDLPWHAVIDASTGPRVPARALELVEPGRRIVLVGLAASPSTLDTRDLALADVTAVGILGASAGLAPAIAAYADGSVDPDRLVAATVSLDDLPEVLAGRRPREAGPGPKIHVAVAPHGAASQERSVT